MGYHIGMEANYKANSNIIFATNGIFLNYIVHNPEILGDFTHVVLDEVHERDLDMDFILILLRCLAPEFPKLKIILMSATLNSSSLAEYYSPARLNSKFLLDFRSKVAQEMLIKGKTKFSNENQKLGNSQKWGDSKDNPEQKVRSLKDEWTGLKKEGLMERSKTRLPANRRPEQEIRVGRS